MDQEKGGTADDKSFEDEIREAVEKHFNEFESGNAYYLMREVFDHAIVMESISRTRKAKLASRKLGLSYKTFQKMLQKKGKI